MTDDEILNFQSNNNNKSLKKNNKLFTEVY